MEIGKRLKTLRESRGLTLEQVGDYIGVNKATVQRYEKGNIDIKRMVAIKLAEMLQTSPSYIMGWVDDSSPKADNKLIVAENPSSTFISSSLNLSTVEQQLILNFRELNDEGQESILRLMILHLTSYKKDIFVSDMEAGEEIA